MSAKANTGIRFVRTDLENQQEINANIHSVSSTMLATTLSSNGQSVSTVEHLMSALYAHGIDNLICRVNADEVPVLDGSSAPFYKLIEKAGIKRQTAFKKFLIVKDVVEIKDGDKWARILPSNEFRIRYHIEFDHPAIGNQKFEYSTNTNFAKEIASSRTFGFLSDVEKMQSMGLALGGSLDNAVVLDNEKVLNPNGLRFKDEFVRHKVLDAIGDLALAGYPIVGQMELYRAGHDLQTKLVKELLSNTSAYTIYSPVSDEDDVEELVLESAYAI